METTKEHTCEIIRIDHPEASYGIFCFNTYGDLFLNSDWGYYMYVWRAFGTDFKQFLANTNTEYLAGKLSIGYREQTGKKLPPHKQKNIEILVTEFIKALKTDVNKPKEVTEWTYMFTYKDAMGKIEEKIVKAIDNETAIAIFEKNNPDLVWRNIKNNNPESRPIWVFEAKNKGNIEVLLNALNRIKNWTDEDELEYEDQGELAGHALQLFEESK